MSYYQKVLYPFVSFLVSEYAEMDADGHFSLSVDDIDYYYLKQFTAHLIEKDDDTLECVSNNNSIGEIVSSLLTMLKKDNTKNCEDFCDTVQEKLVEYYKNTMQSLIDEVCSIEEQEYHYSHGHVQVDRAEDGARWEART